LNPGAREAEWPARYVSDVLAQIQDTRQLIDQAIAQGDHDRAMALARDIDDFLEAIAQRVTSTQGGHLP
jgi:ABC-type Fe3+-hydroxamate transport system substrate-binding protein